MRIDLPYTSALNAVVVIALIKQNSVVVVEQWSGGVCTVVTLKLLFYFWGKESMDFIAISSYLMACNNQALLPFFIYIYIFFLQKIINKMKTKKSNMKRKQNKHEIV